MRGVSYCIILSMLAVTKVSAAHPDCKQVHWNQGKLIHVSASLNKATHITFPENNVDVIVGNNELWDVDHTHNHVWVKPNTKLAGGKETTISFIGESNKSYEILVKRTSGAHHVCYNIEAGRKMINKSAWAPGTGRPGMSDQVRRNANRLAGARQKQVTKQIVEQTQDALKKYRKNIFTDYKVSEGEGWFSNNGNLIDSVYDDGRFTYIRVTDDSRGLMSVYGEIDGKQELLEFDYDSPTKVYQVSGVFPSFKLRAGESELVIKRN